MYYSGLSNNYCIMPTSAIINPLFGYHGNGYVIALNGGITTGNEFLSLGSTPDLHFTEADFNTDGVTVSAWVYFTGSVGGSQPIVTIGKAGTNNRYGMVCQINSVNKPQMHLQGLNGGVAGSGSNNRRTRVATAAISGDRWNHITWVFDGGVTAGTTAANWKIYVDGVAQATNNSGTNASLTLNYISFSSIGYNGGTGGSAQYWGKTAGGFLGDVTIHKTVLSATAISEQFATLAASRGIDWLLPTTNYTAANIATLKAWWQMGSPIGTKTYPTIYEEQNLLTGYNGIMTNMVSGDIVDTPLWG